MPISKNTVNADTVFEEGEGYRALVAEKAAEVRAKNPNAPKEWIPTAVFEPEVLEIRRNEGETPRHSDIRWGSKVGCGQEDVKILLEYIES